MIKPDSEDKHHGDGNHLNRLSLSLVQWCPINTDTRSG